MDKIFIFDVDGTLTPSRQPMTKEFQEFFKEWISKEILKKDDKPGLYVYTQEYEVGGKIIIRIGFFARVKIEDFNEGNIFPHEFTFSKDMSNKEILRQLDIQDTNIKYLKDFELENY